MIAEVTDATVSETGTEMIRETAIGIVQETDTEAARETDTVQGVAPEIDTVQGHAQETATATTQETVQEKTTGATTTPHPKSAKLGPKITNKSTRRNKFRPRKPKIHNVHTRRVANIIVVETTRTRIL